MKILKRENWWAWLLMLLFSEGTSTIVLGALLDVFDKKAWYANWRYWLIGVLCLFFPAVIMMMVFIIQITCETALKLEVKGKEIYMSPYIWILACIIPFLGWLAISVGIIYLEVSIFVSLYRGKGEQYIK